MVVCRAGAYLGAFRKAVIDFLAFTLAYADLADVVTRYATPVGTGTVGRIAHIRIHERTEAIAGFSLAVPR
jgi:hypothetical protein